MKKLFSFLAILGIILASNCSRIPENNNPVIGIWSVVEVTEATETAKKQTLRQEWIFNDAYLGRYHQKNNGSITFKTDFRWTYEDDVYTLTYPGTDMSAEIVSMLNEEDATKLADAAGNIMATRE
ncbi:lipocalin family protein [Pricia sp.]|uniref:lipocalin family protein n=1 Tax=Pricia sp. TaxID=2268138 RepID=UPI0035946D2F